MINKAIQLHKGRIAMIILFVLIMSVTLPFCAIAEDTEKAKAVRIGWYSSTLFQEGMSDDAHKSGYSYDYIHKLADYTGWTYEYVYGEWPQLFAMLQSGEIDLLAGVSKTEERMEYFLYPDEIMGKEHYVLYQRSGSNVMDAANVDTFLGKKIGAVNNNLMTVYLEKWIEEKNAKPQIVYYDSFEERDSDFTSGKIDALVTTDNGILLSSGYAQVAKVGDEAYYLAVAKDRQDLLTDINRALGYIQDIDPYYLNNLEFENYGTTMANSTLSAIEEKWIREHSVLTIGCLSNYLPYCGTDSEGNIYGLITDVMDAILTETNTADRLTVHYKAYPDGEALNAAVKSGEIDAAFPVGGETWQIEKEGIKTTNNVVTSSVNLVCKGSYNEAAVSRFAVTKGNIMMQNYIQAVFPDAELIEYPSTNDCLDAVLSGAVNATTLNGLRSDIVHKNSKYDSLSMIRLSKTDGRCFGVASGSTGLHMFLNRGLKLIGQDYASEVAYLYMTDLYQITIEDFFKAHLWEAIGIIALVGAVIVTLVIRLQRRTAHFLRREEEKNTQLLQHQRKLEELKEEQESQIEEISALNHELEERQAQLEEVTAEQETQIEEIKTLNDTLQERMNIIQSMSKVYFTSFYIDILSDSFMELNNLDSFRTMVGMRGNARAAIKIFCRQLVKEAFVEEAIRFMDLDTLSSRMAGKTYITFKYIGAQSGMWCQGFFIEGDRDENGDLIHVLFATRSIQEEKAIEEKQNQALRQAKDEAQQARQAAETANSAKTTFLFNMSHDIRTPMNAILGYAQLMQKHIGDEQKCLDYLQKIKGAGDFLLSLINNVLEMARIESGKAALAEDIVCIRDVADEVDSVYAELMASKGIQFEQHYDIHTPYVIADKVKLDEILLNLVSNAYKYTQEGGRVTTVFRELACDAEGWMTLQATISDSGIGMSADYLPRLFDEFSREKSGAETSIKGTGLGMPIVKKLLTLMNGTITVDSEPGKGTTFVVTIPLRIAAAPEAYSDLPKEADMTILQGKHILLAEDNELNAEIATEILAGMGITIDHAQDGIQCADMLTKAESGTYDLILMDVQMPRLDGYKATELIRALPDVQKANIPIVAMTANAFEQDKQNAFRAGMNDFIAKPIQIPILVEVLSRVLHR